LKWSTLCPLAKAEPQEWLDAVRNYRAKLFGKVAEAQKPIVTENIIALASEEPVKEFIIPTPDVGEKSDDFIGSLHGESDHARRVS